MFKYIAAAAALVGLTYAAPNSSPSYYGLQQLARFDNDANGVPLTGAAPINIYLDIYWKGMSLTETLGLQDAPGIVPNSPSNYAAFSALDVATVTQGQPAMTVNYDDSTIDHFDLYSFYYGCAVASQESAVGVPATCTITVKGYADDLATKLVASQSFVFTADGLSDQQVLATLKGFTGLKQAQFSVSNSLLTAALIDTVSYKVYSTSPIGA